MTDDYSYSQTQLKKKAEGPFGLAGDSKFGLGSKSSSNPDQPGRGSQTPPQDQGGGGEAEQETGGGGGGGLPAGSSGSLLRHNGSAWVAIGPPSQDSDVEGVLVNSVDGYYYVNASQQPGGGGVGSGKRHALIFNGNNWIALDAPDKGTHVLGIVDNEIQWIETEECEE